MERLFFHFYGPVVLWNAMGGTSLHPLLCYLCALWNVMDGASLVVVVYPLPCPLLVGGVRCSRLWSTSQLLRPFGQQCSHFGGVCPVEEMMCVVCVDVTEGA